MRDADVQAFSWGSASGATPVQRVNVRLDSDSVHVNASARGATQSVARPAPGVRFVMAEESVAAAALLLECARGLRTTDSDAVTMPVIAFPNLRVRQMSLRWRGDSVKIGSSDTSWAYLDRAGRVSRVVLGRSRLSARRVALADLDPIVRAMSAARDYSAPANAPYRAIDVLILAVFSTNMFITGIVACYLCK